jgi:hypothetical protein
MVAVVIVLLEGARLFRLEARRRVPPPRGFHGRQRLRLSLPRASLSDAASA